MVSRASKSGYTIHIVENLRKSESVNSLGDQVQDFDVENLELEIKKRVGERRRSGLYPVGMENELEQQFKYLTSLGRTLQVDHEQLRRLIKKLEQSLALEVPGASTRSKWPLGSFFHRMIHSSIRRKLDLERNRTEKILFLVLEVATELSRALDVVDDLERRKTAVLSNEVLSRLSLLDSMSSRITELELQLKDLSTLDRER